MPLTKPKQRILVVMRSQYAGKPSGVAVMAFALLQALLSETRHDYVLLSPWAREQLPAALAGSRLCVIRCPRPRFMALSVAADLLRMRGWCRSHDIETVLNLDPFGTPVGGSRRVTVVHDLYFREMAARYGIRERVTNSLILRLAISGSQALVCVSEATRHRLIACFPAAHGKVCTIHSGAPSATAKRVAGAPILAEPFYVLAVGNATPNKNFAALGRAFGALHRRHPKLRLVHVGSDPRSTLTQDMSAAARAAVQCLSHIGDADLQALYRRATALCVPSLAEGFCLPVLEAQQAGCPVVCADRSALPEIAGDGALLCDPENPDEIAASLNRLITESELRERLIRQGKANAARFSWREAARRYAALLEAESTEG